MSTGVAPHKVVQLESRALRAENENLRNKVQALAVHTAKLLATLEEHRTSMALIVAACGNRVELTADLLDGIDISGYELKTEQVGNGAIVISLVERAADVVPPDEQDMPAPARSAIAIVPR